MKTRIHAGLASLMLLVLSILNFQLSTARAQNTVVTYQGRITDNGTNFTGTGQFKFALVTSSYPGYGSGVQTATATANVSGGQVASITLVNSGYGYTTVPAVTITGGGGSGATATALLGPGVLAGINVNNHGSGYTSAPTVTIDPPTPTYATFWSHDNSSMGGSEPLSSVSVNVVNGLFTVGLGDTTLANMNALSTSLFATTNLQLRIWFNDGVNGFKPLSPVQNLTTTPYAAFAYSALTASNVSGALTPAQLPAGVLTNNATGVSLSGTFGGNGSGLFNLNAASLVGSLPASYAIGTAITNTSTLVTITEPGSYYLTHNLTVSSGDAIDINTNGVTLDLNGFTIASTEAMPTGTGILLLNGSADITIRNGHIRGGVTNNGMAYLGSGFANGIALGGSIPANVVVTGVSVSGCLGYGIYLYYNNSTTVESCTVQTVGSYGIHANSVSHSSASQCGSVGIFASMADNCYATSTGSIGLEGFSANNCSGTSASGSTGLSAYNAINCTGTCTGSGDGLDAITAMNCQGQCSGSGTGLSASQTATGCFGSSATGDGLDAATAFNCVGQTSGGGHGLVANTAMGCSGTSVTGDGLAVTTANSSVGQSNSGNGLSVWTANNCSGFSSGGNGLYALDTANGCHGSSNGNGTGLWAYQIAIGCHGISSFGTGVRASILNSCVGSSYLYNNKYNMP